MLRAMVLMLSPAFIPSQALAEVPNNLDLESAINGAVSSLGNFPIQEMEDQISAYLEWSSHKGEPFYLFKVAGPRLSGGLPQK